MTTEAPPVPRLKERYRAEIAPALKQEFGYGNVMQIPGLTKIVVNMGAVSYTHLTLPTILLV